MRASRAGFTVIELLIAVSLGVLIVGWGVQHTYEYFRLQGVLMAKAELRHATQQVQDRVFQKLRYALRVVPMAGDFVVVVPTDVDRCGYVCHLDKYELLWWQVLPDPLFAGRSYLSEKRVVVPAFEMPDDPKAILKLYEVYPGAGRRVASNVESLDILTEGPALYRTRVVVKRDIPRQKEPAVMAFMEKVAVRSRPRIQGVAKFETLLPPPGFGGKWGGPAKPS